MRALPAFLLLLLLSACGTLPQPFFGNPGATGALLAQPPPGRLDVPTPSEALLPAQAGAQWARAVADALVQQEIPAAAMPNPGHDWSLALTADLKPGGVVPTYTVRDQAGIAVGSTDGPAIPAADWSAASPATLKDAADKAAPGIVALLARVDAARKQSDPNSLLNRPARIFVAGVTGAPGDGNSSLATQMRLKLEAQGMVVQDTAKNADYSVRADVATAPGASGTTRIELQWIVDDAKGERGRILQINEVAPRAINPYWGDVAAAAASEAAAGVKQVILNAVGGKPR